MQMALGSCVSVYGGISRDTVHVNNQPIMFWSHLEKGMHLGGRPLWSYLFHFFSPQHCKPIHWSYNRRLLQNLDKLYMTKNI